MFPPDIGIERGSLALALLLSSKVNAKALLTAIAIKNADLKRIASYS